MPFGCTSPHSCHPYLFAFGIIYIALLLLCLLAPTLFDRTSRNHPSQRRTRPILASLRSTSKPASKTKRTFDQEASPGFSPRYSTGLQLPFSPARKSPLSPEGSPECLRQRVTPKTPKQFDLALEGSVTRNLGRGIEGKAASPSAPLGKRGEKYRSEVHVTELAAEMYRSGFK